ncbi:helix-turn-helix domain-containing protein [Mycolicibacterium goodii]|uniref:AraC family transcriptional regulator n=1 Tax=Mycolicibacterium goodii TaxID=134601 RepID=A0A0K0XH50_MYCGD|nr:AraC family transcriptional regulator [Mycolicibacterium goodii]
MPGIREVFHARFVDHAYPQHTHDAWTLLIVDFGTIGYELDRREHGSTGDVVTLLPPHVPHNGRAVRPGGFRKRVLYLESDVLTGIGAAVDTPTLVDPLLRDRISVLHRALSPGDELEAASRLAFIVERLQGHLAGAVAPPARVRDRRLAGRLRDLIDSRITTGLTLDEAAAMLHADPVHLVRTFGREFGLPPHRYLTGRRVDEARRLLLDGMRPADVATAVGFHDQSHLHRHFKKMLGTTPARFARRGRTAAGDPR